MSLLWLDETTGLVLSDAKTGLVHSCKCCPCQSWDIVTVCQRGIAVDCDTPDTPCEWIDISLTSADDAGCLKFSRAFLSTAVLDIVRWATFNAPFSGSVEFTPYMDGVAFAEPETITMTEGLPVSYSTDAWGDVLEAGAHHVSIHASFYNSGTAEFTVADRCACVLSYDLGANPSLHGVYILPTLMRETEGAYCISDTLQFQLLKGPFDTKADAEYVEENWRALIADYAATCACEKDFCGTEGGGDATWGAYGTAYLDITDQFDEIGGGFRISAPCPRDMEVEFSSWSTTGTDTVEVINADTLATIWGGGVGTFTIPACTDILIVAKGGNGGTANIYCVATSDDPPDCEIPNEDWFYDADENTGVPSGSGQLADYLASLEI